MIVNPDKFQENKYGLNINNSIIISSVDSVTLLGIEIDSKLNFETQFLTAAFYIFFSRQSNVLHIYFYIVNVFKYLFLLSENKESYFYHYYKLNGFHSILFLVPWAYLYVVAK